MLSRRAWLRFRLGLPASRGSTAEWLEEESGPDPAPRTPLAGPDLARPPWAWSHEVAVPSDVAVRAAAFRADVAGRRRTRRIEDDP